MPDLSSGEEAESWVSPGRELGITGQRASPGERRDRAPLLIRRTPALGCPTHRRSTARASAASRPGQGPPHRGAGDRGVQGRLVRGLRKLAWGHPAARVYRNRRGNKRPRRPKSPPRSRIQPPRVEVAPTHTSGPRDLGPQGGSPKAASHLETEREATATL